MLGTALKPRRLRRYRDIGLLIARFSRSDWGPEELASELERLGPAFIKLGQLLSTRSDLLPEGHLEALSRLQDDVEPFSFHQGQQIIESQLGVRLHKVFRSIDPRPTAAASLAQIHRAELRDGTVVAVKIQRPGLREAILEDMDALGQAARLLDRHTQVGRRYEFARILEEFRRSILRELDFELEASNLRRLKENLAEFDRFLVPNPHEDFSAARLLTMDFVAGKKITALTALRLNEVEGPALADQLFRAYLKQILVDGFFHADPHPGNVVLNPEGVLAILDLGMTAVIGPELQTDLLTLLLAVSEGRSEAAASAALKIGWRREAFDEGEYRRRVEALVLSHKDETVSQMNLGRIILQIARIAGQCGLRLPSELTMIAKALLNLEQIVRTLDPDFEPSAVVRSESSRLMSGRLVSDMSRNTFASGVLEAEKFAAKLPERLSKVLDVLGGKELRVKVDALDEHLLIQGMQKIANRIALGLVLASLIVGAALMMRVETKFRVLEYPGLAIILFLAAVFAGVVLMVDILYYDDKSRTRLRGQAPSEPRS